MKMKQLVMVVHISIGLLGSLQSNAQRVGLGTTDPKAGLHIHQSDPNLPVLLLEHSATGVKGLSLAMAHVPFLSEERSNSKGQVLLKSEMDTDSATNLGILISNKEGRLKEALHISYQGYVGIGEAFPSAQLHVASSTSHPMIARFNTTNPSGYISVSTLQGSYIRLGADGSKGFIEIADGRALEIQSGGIVHMHLSGANGYVGIGTSNPQHQLQVEGIAKIADGVLLGASSTPLDFYREGGLNASILAGQNVVVPNCRILFTRVGKVVTITLPDQKLGLSPVLDTEWRFNRVIPFEFRPQGAPLNVPMKVMVNGMLRTGVLIIDQDGSMRLRPDISNNETIWTGVNNAGFFACSTSFVVVN